MMKMKIFSRFDLVCATFFPLTFAPTLVQEPDDIVSIKQTCTACTLHFTPIFSSDIFVPWQGLLRAFLGRLDWRASNGRPALLQQR